MSFSKYITLHEEDLSVPVIEKSSNDTIFNSTITGFNNMFTTPKEDIYFNQPDYTRHVFSSGCIGTYFMDERNIPLPIYEHDLISNKLINHFNNNKLYIENKGAGIYVVERYVIKIRSGVNYDDMLRTYAGIESIIDIESMNEMCKSIRTSTPTEAVYRIVTYIPNSILRDEKYVYSRQCNLTFSKGLPDSTSLHPRSIKEKETKKANHLDYLEHSNIISIDIINNKNPNKPYYINIANKVHKIFSQISSTRSDGCEIIHKKNDVQPDIDKYTLEELEENGIYDSIDKAKYNTDIDGVIKKKKLENETRRLDISNTIALTADKKLLLEDNKIRLSFMNMEHEKFINSLDKEVKIAGFKSTKHKIEMDYISDKLNFERERVLYKEKLLVEKLKTGQTVITTLFGLFKLFA